MVSTATSASHPPGPVDLLDLARTVREGKPAWAHQGTDPSINKERRLMNDRTSADTSLRVLALWDQQAHLPSIVSFVRGITGEKTPIMLLPAVRGPEAACGDIDVRALGDDAVEILNATGPVPDSVDEIIGIAKARSVNLIVIATTCCAVGAIDHSCGAAALALDSPVPVMLLRTHGLADATPSQLTRVLVPLDGSVRAAQALPLAATLARRLDVPVQLIMVIDPARVLPPAYAYDPEAQDIVSDLRETAHWALKLAEQELEKKAVRVNSSLLYGPVATCIQSAIDPGDLLVMTTHGTGRAAVGKLGSMAAKMVALVTTPLVIIRGQPQEDVVAVSACPWIEQVSRPGAR